MKRVYAVLLVLLASNVHYALGQADPMKTSFIGSACTTDAH